jgi:hypothetical protein
MSTLNLSGTPLGNALAEMLGADEIKPGDAPSYQLCKTIAAYHPLGAKMSDSPVSMAQSQEREIVVPKGPEDRLKEAFQREWVAISADRHIFNTGRLARIYGVASIALLVQGVPSDRPVDYNALYDSKIAFNVLDPLNTAGSLVLNQNPSQMDFQKVEGISVQGERYHRSRSVTLLNEDPLYIEYTTSAFGYVGRSVYQRALFPLKSFIQTLVTDDMVTLKAGVLIAKTKQAGSVVDGLMARAAGNKRAMLKEATVNNVISIGVDEEVETLNFQNLDGPYGMARKNILENVATSADMPAQIINAETFAEGFGEGTEDAKYVAQYISHIRVWLAPLYDFFDRVVMYRAWNREFYQTIQNEFPEYKGVPYTKAFYDWRNSFKATWPNLLQEPDSEKIKVEDVKLKAIIAMVEVLAPMLDPDNKATLVEWACECFNEITMLFPSPLLLDIDALREFVPPTPVAGEGGGKPAPAPPFSPRDSGATRAKSDLAAAVARLPDLQTERARLRATARA